MLGGTLLLSQFSSHPWKVPATVSLVEMQTFAKATHFGELSLQLAYCKAQGGAPRGSIKAPLVFGWGRQDRVVLAIEAGRAMADFFIAQLYRLEKGRHFPHWDQPAQTAWLILLTVQ